jgi:hypothetical protein
MRDMKHSVERDLAGEAKVLTENLLQCHSVYLKLIDLG